MLHDVLWLDKGILRLDQHVLWSSGSEREDQARLQQLMDYEWLPAADMAGLITAGIAREAGNNRVLL